MNAQEFTYSVYYLEKFLPIFIIVFFLLVLQPSLLSAHKLTTANADWPPWRVLEDDGSLSGIDVDILERLSTHLELQLVTKGCGWKRCLNHMKVGESDVMTGLFKTPERENYMKFIDPPYRNENKTCFYINQAKNVKINRFEDLQALTIGVVNEVAYFKQFDNDDAIKKMHKTTDQELFRLLKAGHIDAVIMACVTGDIFLKRAEINDEFKHANYVHSVAHPVYLAISKKSPLITREKDISKALQDMLDKGEIKKIMSGYGVLEGH